MRKIFIIISVCAAFMLASCSEEQNTDAAAHAAKACYDSLVAGNNSYFVRGMYLPDTIPAGYREQLEANAKMFMARMTQEHGGVKDVSIMNCVNDTVVSADGRMSVHTANAFLLLRFGDSLNEEIVVPMIKHKGRWLMR